MGLLKRVSGVDVLLLVCSSSTDRELRASGQVSFFIGQTRPHAGRRVLSCFRFVSRHLADVIAGVISSTRVLHIDFTVCEGGRAYRRDHFMYSLIHILHCVLQRSLFHPAIVQSAARSQYRVRRVRVRDLRWEKKPPYLCQACVCDDDNK